MATVEEQGEALKRCTRCGEIKNPSEFYANRLTRDGRRSECKQCFSGARHAPSPEPIHDPRPMSAAAHREQDRLIAAVYPRLVGQYRTGSPDVAEQIGQSLRRSRGCGYGFDLAWRKATQNLQHDTDRTERLMWVAVLGDDSLREVWRCAYERTAHPGIQAIARLTDALEQAHDVAHRDELVA